VACAASAAFVLVRLSRQLWLKIFSFLAAVLLAHVAYFVAASIALSYNLIVLPDFLVNLFMPGFAVWGAVACVIFAAIGGRIRTGPNST
jgi:hypothetical protein